MRKSERTSEHGRDRSTDIKCPLASLPSELMDVLLQPGLAIPPAQELDFAQRLRKTYFLSSDRPHLLAAVKRAADDGFKIVHIPGAGHNVMVTQPNELTQALLAVI